jgi:hypothetical protein
METKVEKTIATVRLSALNRPQAKGRFSIALCNL